MIARQLIADEILPLNPLDTGEVALGRMREQGISHLPIVDESGYTGLIADSDILVLDYVTEAVGKIPLSIQKPFARETYHLFEVLDTISKLNISVLPVLDENDHYIGSIKDTSLIKSFAEVTAVNNPGGIIVLEMSEKDYLLTEISQIVESNDAKVLSMYINSNPDSTKLEITLKLNRIDITAVMQTFVRYGYTIQASYPEDPYSEGMQDRYNALMNYLNI